MDIIAIDPSWKISAETKDGPSKRSNEDKNTNCKWNAWRWYVCNSTMRWSEANQVPTIDVAVYFRAEDMELERLERQKKDRETQRKRHEEKERQRNRYRERDRARSAPPNVLAVIITTILQVATISTKPKDG